MDPQSILSGAGDVVTGFGSTLLSVILKGLPIIVLYHVPAVLYLVLQGGFLPTGTRICARRRCFWRCVWLFGGWARWRLPGARSTA